MLTEHYNNESCRRTTLINWHWSVFLHLSFSSSFVCLFRIYFFFPINCQSPATALNLPVKFFAIITRNRWRFITSMKIMKKTTWDIFLSLKHQREINLYLYIIYIRNDVNILHTVNYEVLFDVSTFQCKSLTKYFSAVPPQNNIIRIYIYF